MKVIRTEDGLVIDDRDHLKEEWERGMRLAEEYIVDAFDSCGDDPDTNTIVKVYRARTKQAQIDAMKELMADFRLYIHVRVMEE